MKKILGLLSLLILIQGCSSNNIRPFRPDPRTCKKVSRKVKDVHVNVRAKEPQQSSVSCRMVGPIYLPGKATFQQYIQKSFESTLDHADALAHDAASAKHVVDLYIEDINSSSVAGEWIIKGTLSINGGAPQPFKSVTEYGTSFIAVTACRNAADSFDHATEELVELVLSKL